MALLHVVKVGELGQHRAQEAEPVRQREPLDRPGRHEQASQLREDALAGRLAHARRRLAS